MFALRFCSDWMWFAFFCDGDNRAGLLVDVRIGVGDGDGREYESGGDGRDRLLIDMGAVSKERFVPALGSIC